MWQLAYQAWLAYLANLAHQVYTDYLDYLARLPLQPPFRARKRPRNRPRRCASHETASRRCEVIKHLRNIWCEPFTPCSEDLLAQAG